MGGLSALGGGGAQAPPNPFGGAGPDFAKLHAAERDNVELSAAGGANATWVGRGIEERILHMYAK